MCVYVYSTVLLTSPISPNNYNLFNVSLLPFTLPGNNDHFIFPSPVLTHFFPGFSVLPTLHWKEVIATVILVLFLY